MDTSNVRDSDASSNLSNLHNASSHQLESIGDVNMKSTPCLKRALSPTTSGSISLPCKLPKTLSSSSIDVTSVNNTLFIHSEHSADTPEMIDSASPNHYESPPPLVRNSPESLEWKATIERVVKSVVSIQFCQTHAFDTDPALCSEATGFVVDAERGYILTNRHVVSPGPFWGYCVFDNHEECDVYPIYRDPVHDFGFLRFDPANIKYMPVSSLPLRPDLARVGLEIRVVGNDAGEKLSILSGVISRLDRNAPEYENGYCDFNTNYIQAAAAASGGSSGSPVVNIDGFAVALQAGGRSDGAATDYFLPLDRPHRALKCLQSGQPIERGTIQTQWIIKPFDECRRLGLTPQRESELRLALPEETGMLVADVVLPNGPAYGKVQEGDLFIKINGELITQFIRLEEILDSSIDKPIELLVQRGGVDILTQITVADLHSITPDRFLSYSGAGFHDISYQIARQFAISTSNVGVFLCSNGGSFKFDRNGPGRLIQSIDNRDTPNLDTFIEVVSSIPDCAKVVVAYKNLADMHTLHTSIITIDRHWFPKMTLAKRNDNTGLWDFTNLAETLPAIPPKPSRANFIRMENTLFPEAEEFIKSFVQVTTSMPIKLDGFPHRRKKEHGIVIDADKGLVIVSRATIPYDLCDISVTIANSIIVDAKVVFLHPLQNYAIIKYDPCLVLAPVKSVQLSDEAIRQGEEVIFFGFNQKLRPVLAKTVVTDVTTAAIPASLSNPRYRASNLDAVTVDTNLATQCGSGVLISKDGLVRALWLTYLGERNTSTSKDLEYHLGLPTAMIMPVIQQVQHGIVPKLRILDVEMYVIQMSQARIMGVPESWIERVEREDPERHQLFMVRKVDPNHIDGLQESDIILTLNGKLITRVSGLDVQYTHDILDADVVRRRKVISIKVPTVPTEDLETDRALIFCGAVLHRPHHAVRQQISTIHSQVYISRRNRGSPAFAYGIVPTNFITAVNGIATPDLDSFLAQVLKIPDNTYFRLRMVTFDNLPWVATMKKNNHYFPLIEFRKDASNPLGWKRINHDEL